MTPPAPVLVWALTIAGRVERCEVFAHPLGVELVALVDGDVRQTQVARTPAEGEQLAAAWRAAFEAKGWALGEAEAR